VSSLHAVMSLVGST